jgi:hypothetical protein
VPIDVSTCILESCIVYETCTVFDDCLCEYVFDDVFNQFISMFLIIIA